MIWTELRNYENHTDSRAPKSAAEKIDASVSILANDNFFFVNLASMIPLSQSNH